MSGAGNFLNDMPKTYKTWANGFRTLTETFYKKGPDYRQGIFNMETTNNLEDRDVEIGGIGEFEEWLEGQPAPLDEVREGFEVKYRQYPYAKRVAFGRLARKFYLENVRSTKTMMTKMGTKAWELEQRSAFDLLSQGFSATFNNGYGDGKRTFSGAHPLSPHDATTWSNVLTDSAVLSEASLQALFTLLDTTPDDRGNEMHLGKYGYTIVVTNLQDYLAAQRLVNVDADLRPGTANNDINVFSGKMVGMNRPITVTWVPYAANATNPRAFYVLANQEHQLNVLTSESFNTDVYEDDASKTLFVRASLMFAVGLGSPRGIVASLGDGTTTVNW